MKRRLIHILIAVLFVVALFGTAHAAGFQQHLVQKGETLSEIAQKYKVPLKSIIQANSIKSAHRIRTGRTLRIPGEALTFEDIWYKVQPGDTLFSIGRRHNIEWRDLQRINGISSPRSLQIGRMIRINERGPGFGKPARVPLVVTSKYGYRPHPVTGRYQHHAGIDFRAAIGTRVYASKAVESSLLGGEAATGKSSV